jgi:hypothetical protein
MKRGKNSIKGIGGWLLVVLLDFIFSTITTFILFMQKLMAILTNQAKFGVYISAFLLLAYCISITITIFMILTKRKLAIKIFIITAVIGAIFLIWYYLISQLIYYYNLNQIISNLIFVLINLAITVLIAAYLIKSKRVKNTLTK